jgi:homoserine/homoserine lactone efflux protein
MPLELYLGFVAATTLLILTPGPMVALIVANTVRAGLRAGLITIAGSAAAMIVHLLVVTSGLSALLAAAGSAFFWLKWIGAAYLLYLGMRALLAPAPPPGDIAEGRKSGQRTFGEAFLVAFTNPKTLLFYAAFFPLFLSPDSPATPQLVLMSGTFLAVACVIDTGWAFSADRARQLLAKSGRWVNRATGGVLIIAAASLAAIRRG